MDIFPAYPPAVHSNRPNASLKGRQNTYSVQNGSRNFTQSHANIKQQSGTEFKEIVIPGEDGQKLLPDTKNYYRKRRLLMAILFCSILFSAEFAGGLIAGSLAILSDSFHMLTDVIGYTLSYLALYYSGRPENKFYSYGYKRIEVIGAMLSILLIWVLAAGLIIEASFRFSNPTPIDSTSMLWISIAGVVVNIMLIFIFSHEEPADKQANVTETKVEETKLTDKKARDSDLNIRAAILHAVGDLVCSVGVVIAALIIYFNPDLVWVDPLCTVIFGIVALLTTFSVIRDIYKIFMQATPPNIDIEKIHNQIKGLDTAIVDAHCRVWSLTNDEYVSDINITIRPPRTFGVADSKRIINSVRKMMEKEHKVAKNTIEILFENHLTPT